LNNIFTGKKRLIYRLKPIKTVNLFNTS